MTFGKPLQRNVNVTKTWNTFRKIEKNFGNFGERTLKKYENLEES